MSREAVTIAPRVLEGTPGTKPHKWLKPLRAAETRPGGVCEQRQCSLLTRVVHKWTRRAVKGLQLVSCGRFLVRLCFERVQLEPPGYALDSRMIFSAALLEAYQSAPIALLRRRRVGSESLDRMERARTNRHCSNGRVALDRVRDAHRAGKPII